MKYIFDSNVIIDILRGSAEINSKIQIIKEFCLTPIVLCELFKGACLSQKKDLALSLVDELIFDAEILDFSEESCRIFGEKYAELQKMGKITEEPDLMIASIAIAHNATLVTRNSKDFHNISGLKLLAI